MNQMTMQNKQNQLNKAIAKNFHYKTQNFKTISNLEAQSFNSKMIIKIRNYNNKNELK